MKSDNTSYLIKGSLITLVGAGCWGVSATLVKYLLDTYQMYPAWLVCVRELGACWLFLFTAFLTNRNKLVEVLKIPKVMFEIFAIGLIGILFSNITYIMAIQTTNPATATILQSLSVLMVMLFVCVKSRRLPKRREIAGVVLALAGTYLLSTGGNFGKLILPPEGILWGIGAAVTAAIFTAGPVNLLKNYGSFVVNGYAMLACGIVYTAYVQPWNHMPVLDPFGWVLVVLVVIIGTYGAYALFMHGISMVGSLKASLLNNAEPVMAIVTSFLILGTTFSFGELIGFAMIIVMVFLTA